MGKFWQPFYKCLLHAFVLRRRPAIADGLHLRISQLRSGHKRLNITVKLGARSQMSRHHNLHAGAERKHECTQNSADVTSDTT